MRAGVCTKIVPIIKVDTEEYEKYFNPKFVDNQLRRYFSWLSDYHYSGRVAFYNCKLHVNNYGTMILTAWKDTNITQYGWMATLLAADENYYSIIATGFIDKGKMHLNVDIPNQDESWKKLGFNTFDDLPDYMKQEALEIAKVSGVFFAKIQSNALKCQTKIMHMTQKANTRIVKQGELFDDSQYPPIVLSPGIKCYIVCAPNNQHEYTRHCESWGVRGHYRHYKNGKVVYIAPFTKGSGRLKQSTYLVKEKTNESN